MNEINERQNSDLSIDKLAAQSQLYSDAKNKLGIYVILSIPIMIILNLLVKPGLLNDWLSLGWVFDLTNSIALYAILLSAYELIFLKKSLSILKEKASKIQEDFDCYVYDLEWNPPLCEEKECDSEIKKYSDKFLLKGKDRGVFVDWYTPDVDQIDKVKAILVCQKENLSWDVEQRSVFIKFITIVSTIVFITSLVAGFYLEITLDSFILSVLIPSWPALSYAVNSYNENNIAIGNKIKLKIATDKVSQMKTVTVKYARNIQNIIYINRKDNQLIFDWFYEYLRDKNQSGVTYATRQLIKKLL